jgi:hypothetical protein
MMFYIQITIYIDAFLNERPEKYIHVTSTTHPKKSGLVTVEKRGVTIGWLTTIVVLTYYLLQSYSLCLVQPHNLTFPYTDI